MAERTHKTWILTGSLENFRINVERGFDLIGLKERRRNQAEEFEPGDEVVFYVTGAQAFGGVARVRSEMFEDREPIWPQGLKKHPEPYPWRVQAEPVLVLDEREFLPASELVGELEHISKWPREHWHLAFQGQLRMIGDADARLLRERMGAAAADLIHERHFTREQADKLLPTLAPLLTELRRAKASLTDTEAHEVLAEASAGNGGGAEGRQVGEAFLHVRGLLGAVHEAGVVVRDIDSGLVDFPSLLDGREIYLCWRLGEDAVDFWHELDSGFAGRHPLD